MKRKSNKQRPVSPYASAHVVCLSPVSQFVFLPWLFFSTFLYFSGVFSHPGCSSSLFADASFPNTVSSGCLGARIEWIGSGAAVQMVPHPRPSHQHSPPPQPSLRSTQASSSPCLPSASRRIRLRLTPLLKTFRPFCQKPR